jgi:hypothetical protein
MSRSQHQASAPWRHIDDWRRIPASVKRRLRAADDSSPDDVPAPEEIDPSLLDRFDCDHDPDFGGAPLADDDQPYTDAP